MKRCSDGGREYSLAVGSITDESVPRVPSSWAECAEPIQPEFSFMRHGGWQGGLDHSKTAQEVFRAVRENEMSKYQ